MKYKVSITVAVIAATVFLLSAAGCTDLERQGFSPIPQNTPASWELNPYGDFQN